MELRVLHYFLTIAREQSISGAAEFLHISQPTLSRQMKDMEPSFHISIMKMPFKERDLYNLMRIIHWIMRSLERMYI